MQATISRASETVATQLLSSISLALQDILHAVVSPHDTSNSLPIHPHLNPPKSPSVYLDNDFVLDTIRELLPVHFGPVLCPSGDLLIPNEREWKDAISQALEYESRSKLQTLVAQIQYAENNAPERAKLFDSIYCLLDIILECQDQALARDTVALQLVEDLVEMLPIQLIDRIFDYLDSRYNRIVTGIEPGRGRALVVLRICNEALRRLERTGNATTCGRVLMFVAAIFPVTEKSGNNVQGKFNVDNMTYLEDQPDVMLVDSGAAAPQDDWSFYRRFWEIQRYFSNPPSILEGDAFVAFRNDVEAILTEFEKQEMTIATSDAKDGKKRKRGADKDHPNTPYSETPMSLAILSNRRHLDSTCFFSPKYLTSHTLFSLELRDSNFRRQILLQHCIILHFLTGFSQKIKDAEMKHLAEVVRKPPNPRILQIYQYTLTLDQESWVVETMKRIYKLMDRMKEKKTSITARAVITHERNWTRWKWCGCPEFDSNVVPAEFNDAKPKLVSKSFERKNAERRTAKDMETRGKQSLVVPVHEFFAKLNEERDDKGDLKPTHRRSAAMNELFVFRSYRLARRQVLSAVVALKTADDAGAVVPLLLQLRDKTPGLYGYPEQLKTNKQPQTRSLDAPLAPIKLNNVETQDVSSASQADDVSNAIKVDRDFAKEGNEGGANDQKDEPGPKRIKMDER
ncbi:hypothetical protein SeLEV6574_g01312 [Synchytrium endobioticum]|uniref:Uncharacterized protein n=1 Tax=Synchytrium endobioticum TaxID=286115 RepID=A0A507DDN7_9FUNG|nr:hypothetical protein SeLEV6574_g01312 [Synchytrium endobioticum]